MTELKELGVALAYLSGVNAFDAVDRRFSEDDKSLFLDWFFENWNDQFDTELEELQLDKISAKIKQLKGE